MSYRNPGEKVCLMLTLYHHLSGDKRKPCGSLPLIHGLLLFSHLLQFLSLPCKWVHFRRVRFQTPAFISSSLSSMNSQDIHIGVLQPLSRDTFSTAPNLSHSLNDLQEMLNLLFQHNFNLTCQKQTNEKIHYFITSYFFLRTSFWKDFRHPLPALRITRVFQFPFLWKTLLNPPFNPIHIPQTICSSS